MSVPNILRDTIHFTHTFSELTPVKLSCLQLNGDNMSQRFVKELDGYTEA